MCLLLTHCQKKEDPQAGFNIETLLICILDLIEAGTEAASTTLRWALLYMIRYPEIQSQSIHPHSSCCVLESCV